MLMERMDECYDFATFRLYPKLRTLKRDGEVVAIGGRAFDMLLTLVSRAGEVISLSDLMKAVWPHVTVEEANLRVQMGTLRRILAQCEQAKRAVETVPLRGYCFILPVQHVAADLEEQTVVVKRRQPLPALVSRVVGREATIDAVLEALAHNRLVTLTGPGGIGKTTVAIASAQRFDAESTGTTGFIDLSAASRRDDAVEAIAAALGIDAAHDGLGSICDFLKTEDTLVVLDTCEHIVDAVAEIAETLLAQCTRLRLLVTSREVLRAAGEWALRIAPLAWPDPGSTVAEDDLPDFAAMTLFIERLKATAHWSLEARHLSRIAEICRRLDGIPLALELAAGRVADLGVAEFAANLDDCLGMLTRGRRTALPRHRTLSATLDWSYDLLTAGERSLLGHLAIYDRAFSTAEATASAARAGCEAIAEGLIGLFDKSLLTIADAEDQPTFRLLNTTRDYVMAK